MTGLARPGNLTQNTNGGSFYIVAPIGQLGIALVGDTGEFVTGGGKRITSVSDDGTLHIGAAYAEGETEVTRSGYAPSKPNAPAAAGTTDDVTYNEATRVSTAGVSPDKAGTATVHLCLAKTAWAVIQ
jgi:hypothetical protein